MAFDSLAMDETFLMSNISPQAAAFNMGVWRDLEGLARNWGRKFGRLYVVTGPVLTLPGKEQIGFSKVTVPAAYYKVLLAPEQQQAIAFIIPNQLSDRPLMDYACNIDKVEKVTGIDFFPRLRKDVGDTIEALLDKGAW
jgi:endonuclease G